MPAALVRVSRPTPVPVLVNVTFTLGMTDLVESWTVPETTPRPVCAAIGSTTKASARQNFFACWKEVEGPINSLRLLGSKSILFSLAEIESEVNVLAGHSGEHISAGVKAQERSGCSRRAGGKFRFLPAYIC